MIPVGPSLLAKPGEKDNQKTASRAANSHRFFRYTASAWDEDRTELTSHAAIRAAIDARGRADDLLELPLQMTLVRKAAEDCHFS